MAPKAEQNAQSIPPWVKTVMSFAAILVAVGVLLGQANANEKRSLKNEVRMDVIRTQDMPKIRETLIRIDMQQKALNAKLDQVLKAVKK